MNHSESEKRYRVETKAALSGKDSRQIIAKIRELKATGKVSILSYILDLLNPEQEEEVRLEVFNMVSDLRDQECVPVIIKYIKILKGSNLAAGLIASCWQSQLDFSQYLDVFAECFINGTYQDAIESFTIIEEMLWQSNSETVENCRLYILSRQQEVSEEKLPLFRELVKLLLSPN